MVEYSTMINCIQTPEVLFLHSVTFSISYGLIRTLQNLYSSRSHFNVDTENRHESFG